MSDSQSGQDNSQTLTVSRIEQIIVEQLVKFFNKMGYENPERENNAEGSNSHQQSNGQGSGDGPHDENNKDGEPNNPRNHDENTPSKERLEFECFKEQVIKRLPVIEDNTDIERKVWYTPPKGKLPKGFKFPKIAKYDGRGPPASHINMYLNYLKPQGLTDDWLLNLFHQSLTGLALDWYQHVKKSKISTWPTMIESFVEYFTKNIDHTIALRQLESLRQWAHEVFIDWMSRWDKKVFEMFKRPSEENQLRMLMKNVSMSYRVPLSMSAPKNLAAFRRK
ncbi:hypothetical protein MKW92_041438 [Papaver armeniacum]|nr:hypothetical protein MKW92_041438 [Papaver armeniacum]